MSRDIVGINVGSGTAAPMSVSVSVADDTAVMAAPPTVPHPYQFAVTMKPASGQLAALRGSLGAVGHGSSLPTKFSGTSVVPLGGKSTGDKTRTLVVLPVAP